MASGWLLQPSGASWLGTLLVDRAVAKRRATSVYARALLFAGVMVVVSTVPNQALIDLVGFTPIGIATMQAEVLLGPLVLLATPEQMGLAVSFPRWAPWRP